MRTLGLVMVVIGCGASPRPGVDVDAGPDAPGEVDGGPGLSWDERRSTTAVIVGPTSVVWSRSDAACALESGDSCPPASKAVLAAPLVGAVAPTVQAMARHGVSIVGEPGEVFFIDRDAWSGVFVVRVRSEGITPSRVEMSIPRQVVEGLAVDATHVYWFEGGVNGAPSRYLRATRAGDGSDAVSIAELTHAPEHAQVVGATLWWDAPTTPRRLYRVAVTGGTPEEVAAGAGGVLLAATDDEVFLDAPGTGTSRRLIALDAAGASRMIAADIPQAQAARSLVVDGGELIFASASALYRVPLAGGVAAPVTGIDTASNAFGWAPFGVTPDAILYDFTATAYRTAPR